MGGSLKFSRQKATNHYLDGEIQVNIKTSHILYALESLHCFIMTAINASSPSIGGGGPKKNKWIMVPKALNLGQRNIPQDNFKGITISHTLELRHFIILSAINTPSPSIGGGGP